MYTSKQLIIGIGELLWDCFGSERRPGGAPSNVAYHANQLGLESFAISSVGKDTIGDDLLDAIRSNGLDTTFIQRDPHHPTGIVTVDTSDADHPTYTIHENAAWDYIQFEDHWHTWLKKADALCFGTLAQRHVISRAAIHQAIQAASQAMIVYDVNLRPPWLHVDWITQSLSFADIVKLNAEEVVTMCELLNWPLTSLSSFATHLIREFNANYVFITKAEQGCFAANKHTSVDIPGKAINVADAVGAGDAFTAALIYGLLKSKPLEKIAAFANDVGSLVASKTGAMPSLTSEFETLQQHHEIA